MHFDFSERMCMHQSNSLSFSLFTFAKKRFGSRSDPNGTRERMFRQFKNVCILLKVRSVVQKPRRKIRWVFSTHIGRSHARQGSVGPDPPFPVNHKNIEYLNNTGPDPLKFSKLPSQHSTMGHHRHPAERHLNGVSLAGR